MCIYIYIFTYIYIYNNYICIYIYIMHSLFTSSSWQRFNHKGCKYTRISTGTVPKVPSTKKCYSSAVCGIAILQLKHRTTNLPWFHPKYSVDWIMFIESKFSTTTIESHRSCCSLNLGGHYHPFVESHSSGMTPLLPSKLLKIMDLVSKG